MSKILHCFLCLIFLGYTGVAMAATVVGGGTVVTPGGGTVVTPGGGTVVGPSATPSGSYSCPTYRKYSSCAEGYYLAYSYTGTSYNSIRYYSTPRAGNACRPCTDYDTYNNRPEGYYYCAGGTARPVFNKVTITYNLNGGDGSVPSPELCTPNSTCPLVKGNTTSFWRAGYVFKGWTPEGSTSDKVVDFDDFVPGSEDMTLYAVWVPCGIGKYKPGSGTQAAAACSSCPELTPGFEYFPATTNASLTECRQGITNAEEANEYCNAPSETTELFDIQCYATSDGTWGDCAIGNVWTAKPGSYVGIWKQEMPAEDVIENMCIPCGVGTYSEGGLINSCSSCPELTPGFEYAPLKRLTSINNCTQVNYDISLINNNCTSLPGQESRPKINIRASAETGDWATYAVSPTEGAVYAVPGAYVNQDMMTNGEHLDIAGFDASNLCVACTDATFSPGGDVHSCSACPPGYDANTETGKTSAAECQISCDAGTYVATANATCTTVGSGYYKAAHMVNYGSTSTRDQCPANYRDGAAASSESGCQTSCDAGTYVKTANAACTAVGSGYYKAAHMVNYGSTSTRDQCPSGYQNSDAGADVINDCYMNVSGGKYVERENATTAATCVAGTYKAAHTVYYGSTSSCSACTGRTKYSGAGASACKTVDSGYYSTGCNASGNNCTGQSQCTGATYCTGGVQNSCPAQTSGWTRNGGTGWTSYTQCNQRRTASAISQYCVAGTLRQVAISATEWGETFISEDLEARRGAYVSGQTCLLCTEGNYCAGGPTEPQKCPTAYPNSDTGAAVITSCYSNTKSRPWSGSQVNGTVPTNCSAVTEWGICSRASCDYVAYSNSTGTADGTIKSGCETNNDSCTKPVQAVSAKPGFYDAGTTCTECPSGYPNSDADNEGGVTQCYSNTKSRPWSGSQVNGTVPTNCSAVTEWGTCSKDSCDYVAYANSAGTADGTIKSGCETNAANCTKPVKAVSAKSGFYDAGTTCTECPSGYPNSDADNEGGITQCYSNTKSRPWSGSQVNGSIPTNCSAVTEWGTCSKSACEYVAYSNSAGTADGTVKSGCKTNSENCVRPVVAVAAESGYYDAGTTCTECPSGYPNSDADNEGGITQCYSDEKSRPWMGGQISCKTPAGCSDSTCNICTLPACSYVAYSNSTGSADGAIKSGCATNNEDCQQTVKSVTANAGYIVQDNDGVLTCAVCTGATYSAGGSATNCTACPSIYTDNTDSAKTNASQCQVITTGGYYIANANDDTETDCGTTYYCPSETVNYGDTNERNACPVAADHRITDYPDNFYNVVSVSAMNQSWGATNISSISQCVAQYTVTNERGTFAAENVKYNPETEKYDVFGNHYYSKVNPGYYGNEKWSEGYCDESSRRMLYKDALPCPAGSYCPGFSNVSCGSGEYNDTLGLNSCPVAYPSSPALSSEISACYLTTTPKNFVATANAAQTTCTAGGYCVGGVKVNYGSTGGRTPASKGYYVASTGATTQTPCAVGTYTATTGQTKCTDAVAGTYTTGCGSNNTACTGTAVCANNSYSAAKASSCTACNTADGYGNSGTSAANHAGIASCKASCGGGEYVPTAGGGCVNVGVGYWGAGGTVAQDATLARNQCDSGLTTIGSGAGADEAGDCGRVLNVNGEKIYLRSTKKTTPSLNVGINGKTFYGNMGTATKGTLRINSGGTTYSVYDDSM